MRQRYILTHADALKVVSTIQQELERDQRGAAIAVADEHGELMALLRTDGCPLASINIAINKAFTASREGQESKNIGKLSKEEGWPMTNYGDLRYTAWGGGVPIIYNGVCVGGVGVSGLPEADDMVLARLGVKALAED